MVGAAADLPEGGRAFVKAPGRAVQVVRTGGALYAADARCPCPLSGGALARVVELDGAPCVECDARCYTLAFDLRTGRNVRAFDYAVEVYPVRVEGGQVVVELSGAAVGGD